jgi:Fur family ferric uptake transcriptional regulator/Fur family peroxide stress response transcriptional regulator
MARSDDPLALELRTRGLRATPQRLVIAQLLREQPRHVTAEELFDEARALLPGISLPTVYATLDLLAEVGAVRQVPLPSGAAVYDSRVDPHHHVRCRRCGAVQDLDVVLDDAAARASAERQGFADVDTSLMVSGVCAACRGLD